MKLAALAQGRDNNFNLIRILAALAVLVSHSYPTALGPDAPEPLEARLGMTLGLVAVDAFFVTSGFLVTASLDARQSALRFAWARALRILPALAVMLLLSALVLGAAFTTLPLAAYFADAGPYHYLARGTTLFFGVEYHLPGVFEGNAYRGVVNASLWTLPYEVYMYSLLAALWIVAGASAGARPDRFRLLVVALAAAAAIHVVVQHVQHGGAGHFERLLFMFFSGAAFHVLRTHVVMSGRVFWLCVLGLAVASAERQAFFVVYAATAAYVLLYLAYVPAGAIRRYNRVGDYSYGLYIYAFPVQQSIAALMPGITVPQMIALAAAASLALAALSWHLLERHALGLKDRPFGAREELQAG